jgi:DNA-binding CsgD family transcriptional regulator
VVEYLADNIADTPILTLVSVRGDPPSRAMAAMRALASRRSASIVEVRRLTDDEVVSVAAGCLRAAVVPPGLEAMLTARADGLPFLAEELVASMVRSGELRQTPDGWVVDEATSLAIPPTFAESVRNRVAQLPGARDLLTTAALLGRSFDWRLLATMTGRSDGEVSEQLRVAVDAQLLSVETTRQGSAFCFRHALTREAVLAELLPPERFLFAARALQAIEAERPGLPGQSCQLAAELAEAAGDLNRAAALHLESGRRAFGRGALATAETNVQRARALVRDDPLLTVEIDEVLCEVLVEAGQLERLEEAGQRLLSEMAVLSLAPARWAHAHLWLARAAVVAADWVRARDHIDHARELTSSDGTAVAQVDILAARVALGEGQLDEAAGLAHAALVIAEAGGRPELRCEALEILGQRERQRDLASAADAFSAALDVAEAHGLSVWRVRALHELGTVDLLAGGPLDRLAQARDAAVDAGALATAATVSLQMAAWFTNHADPAGVFDAAGSCAAEAARLRLPLIGGIGHVLTAVAHAQLDQQADMDRAVDRGIAASGGHPEVLGVAAIQARALLWFVREDRARALAELDAGMDLLRGSPVTAPNRGLWALMHAIDCADGEAAVAEVEASGLTVYWLIRGWVGHARAVLLGRGGLAAEAAEAFVRADAVLAPCDWFRQHAKRLVAEAAIADGWGDPVRWLEDALAFFDRAGPPAVASACRSLLRRAGAPVPRRRRPAADLPAPLAAAGITERESEVLTLLADARSTREIADRLYLSPKTVERHIANLAAKVGVDGRSELVAFAARNLPGSALT